VITNLLIRNFQSHKRSDFAFHPNVNIIIGASDSGKSSIIRSLRWLVWNRPSGSALQSHWIEKNDFTVVKVWQGENTSVSKEMRNGKSVYIKHSQKFEAFGTNVPEEINRFLNFNDINIQYQLEPHFLLSKTPGEVAQYFNKIAKLDQIDTGLSNINSNINELNQAIGKEATKDKPATGLIKQIKDAEISLAKLDYLKDFEKEVLTLEELQKQYLSQGQKIHGLRICLQRISEINDEIDEQNAIANLEKPVDDLLKLYEELKMTNKTKISLFKLLSRINDTTNRLNRENALYGTLKAKYDKIGICFFCGNKIKK